MNKRELIEHISSTLDKYLKNTTFVKPVLTITEIAKSDEVSLEFEVNKNCILLDDNRQELNKPVVPQFVADWIEESRTKGWDLLASMCFVLNAKNKKTTKWFYLGENKNIFALAWIFGYTVEKEKKYRVSLKNGQPLVKAPLGGNFYFNQNITGGKYKATRKELEDAGFGEVFNSPLFEVEEVE